VRMAKWTRAPLGNVADLCLGKMLDQDKNRGEPLPYLANVNVRWGEFVLDNLRTMRFEPHERERYGLKFGDIVMCEGGEPGRCAIWKEQTPGMMIQKALHRIRPHEVLDFQFLFYNLLNLGNTKRFDQYFTGATIKHLPGEKLAKVEVDIPPLPVQRRIAGILSAYDDLIENSRRRIKILETMARALYREWFVQFRFPGHENHPRVASPLGETPEGWEAATFSQAANFENGDRGKNYPNGSDFVGDGIPFINAGHLVDGSVNLFDMNYIDETKFGQLRSGKIRNGDILFCLRGSLGRTARTAILSVGAIASSLVIIRPTKRTNETFLFYTLTDEIGKQMVAELNNGAAQPNVSVGSIQNYPLLLPPKNLLLDLERSIDPIWRQMELLRSRLSNFRKQRDLLLPRLLSGQIEVDKLPDPVAA